MSDAPERIWATGGHYWANPTFKRDKTEYTRADLAPLDPLDDPRVGALVEQSKITVQVYDQWANCASGTPEDTISAAALFLRINRLRAALAALKGNNNA